MQDESIIIRPSDKGSQVVIMNVVDYATEIEKQLENDKIYRKTNELTLTKIEKKVSEVLGKLERNGKIT